MDSEVVTLANRLQAFKTQAVKARTNFGVALTQKCHLGCDHCINNSLPNNNQELRPAQIRNLCSQLVATKEFDTINLSGGEPFEVLGLLLEATKIITSFGLRATVVTSASWAVSANAAYEMILPLHERGLGALIVSRDEFHEARVPHSNVVWALKSSLRLGIVSAINLTIGAGGKDSDELLKPIADGLNPDEFKRVQINEAGLLRAGRALGLQPAIFGDDLEREIDPFVCNIAGPILLANGEFVACCGAELPYTSPLRRGHCDTTDAGDMVRTVRTDPLVRMIRYLGLRRMAELVGPGLLRPELTTFIQDAHSVDLCTVCIRLLSDPERVARLRHLAEDPQLKREMARIAILFYGDSSNSEE